MKRYTLQLAGHTFEVESDPQVDLFALAKGLASEVNKVFPGAAVASPDGRVDISGLKIEKVLQGSKFSVVEVGE